MEMIGIGSPLKIAKVQIFAAMDICGVRYNYRLFSASLTINSNSGTGDSYFFAILKTA
jgi:hypothetical protein